VDRWLDEPDPDHFDESGEGLWPRRRDVLSQRIKPLAPLWWRVWRWWR
jgi:hypothetical protein